MTKRVLIIGGGIAGLTTGCYLQKFGFETELFEAHNVPGGLCTSWKKGDYTVDGCINWLVGTHPQDPVHALWNEVINLEEIQFHYYDEFFRVRDLDGKEIIAYTDLARLEQELLEKAPSDARLVREFISAVRKFRDFPLKFEQTPELRTLKDRIKDSFDYFPYLPALLKYSKMRIADFAARCKDPLLAKFFNYSFAAEMPLLFILITFTWLDKKNAGYPIGGSLRFSRLFEKRYLEWGGKIHYNARVTNILTEENGRSTRARGIELEDGREFTGDIIISAADGYTTIFEMLKGRFVNKRVKHYYDHFAVFPSLVHVSLGINKDLGGFPSPVAFALEKPYRIDPQKEIENIYYRIFNFDPTLAPPGKTLVNCMVQTYNYQYWKELRESDYSTYKKEKERIANFYIDQLDRELGGIKDKIEMVDVSTPATVIRYTGNWRGSFEGWMVTKETGFNSLPKRLPGLEDFFMVGQWVEPGGGIPAVFVSGRNLSKIIARKYNRLNR